MDDRGSITIEAVLSFSLVMILLMILSGTILTVYADSEVEWRAFETINTLQYIVGPIFEDGHSSTESVLNQSAYLVLSSKAEEHSLYEVLETDFSYRDGIYEWTIEYQYTFASLFGNRTLKLPMNGALVTDELTFEGATVYVTNYGEKYHTETCYHLRKSKIPIDLESAIEQGYEACKHCQPNVLEE